MGRLTSPISAAGVDFFEIMPAIALLAGAESPFTRYRRIL
jgi:hypothetical protein